MFNKVNCRQIIICLTKIQVNTEGSIYSENSILQKTNSQFSNCTFVFGGCIYIYQGSLTFEAIQSIYSAASQDGGFLYITSVNKFILSNINTKQCYAQNNGGQIYILNSSGTDSFISSANFEKNIARGLIFLSGQYKQFIFFNIIQFIFKQIYF
ncbi:hypothetical protein ABPG72_009792 [Tetrahymena utriculariae]